MNILFIVGGYPSEDKPYRGIFNARAVKALSLHANVIVCHFRYWKPGCKLIQKEQRNNTTVLTLSLPYIPIHNSRLAALQLRIWANMTKHLLKSTIQQYKFDIIHSVNLEMAPIGCELSKAFSIPHFSQATGSDIKFYMPAMEKYWSKKIHWIAHTKGVICNSKDLKERVHIAYPTTAAFVCYRGVDSKEFDFVERSLKPHKQFLYLGGFSNRQGTNLGTDLKGGEFLKIIWSKLEKSDGFNGSLIICGPDSNSSTIIEWKETLQHPEKIKLLGDVKPKDIPELMQQSDFLLLPSRSEGLPNVVLEAVASGLVVVASNVGGVPEIIKHNETGFLLNSQDEEQWISTILEITKPGKDFTIINKKAREMVVKEFNALTYGERLLNIYYS